MRVGRVSIVSIVLKQFQKRRYFQKVRDEGQGFNSFNSFESVNS